MTGEETRPVPEHREIARLLGLRLTHCAESECSEPKHQAQLPDYDAHEIFWPEFEKWIKRARVGDGINGVYAKMEIYTDGSGHFGIYDFNTDKKVGYCETNPDPSKRITLGRARCIAWVAGMKALIAAGGK